MTFFAKALKDAKKKYESKLPKYGESWKTMSIDDLEARLMEEMQEYASTQESKDAQRSELLDIINVALMLATRLEEMRC